MRKQAVFEDVGWRGDLFDRRAMSMSKNVSKYSRPASTVALISVVLLASWMGGVNGGYFVGDWAPVAFVLAALVLVASVTGMFRGSWSRWSLVSSGFLAAYTAWTLVSLYWSPNRGDAWVGVGQTFLYLLVFGVAVALLASGASRRWALVASVLGPAAVAAFTLSVLASNLGSFFDGNRLVGTVGYFNGEAAFLLVPFWAAIYLAGSRRVDPILRGLVLAGATLGLEVAIMAQSRGALVSMVVSSVVFFALSGQRLRGFLALAPVAVVLFFSLNALNEVYLAFLNEENPTMAVNRVVPIIWLGAIATGLYALSWGVVDRRWRPPANVARVAGGAVLVVFVAVSVFGAVMFVERVGDPIAWSTQKWEAFKTDDVTGEEQSRYLSSSGSGRYTLWQVAWEDFASNPLLGVGTHNYEATYYQMREQNVGFARQPHMLPLEVLGERGVIGGILFFGFMVTCLAAGLRQRFNHLNAEGKALLGATLAALVYWLVHSSSDWFWQMPAVTLPAMVYLAMLVAPWNKEEETAPARWPVRLVGAGAAVLAVAIIAPLYLADRYLAHSYAIANPWVALQSAQRAQWFNPVNPQPAQREAELRIQIGDWPRVVQAYENAIELNPEHYAPYTLLARFYEQRGEPEEALSSYREALALNPLDAELQESVSRLEGQVGGSTTAREAEL